MLKVHAQKYGDATIVCLRGGVVTGDMAILKQTVQTDPNARLVVLDFRQVNRIDAGGLGVLLELREHLKATGRRFSLMNVTEMVQSVLEISHLNTVFEILSEGEVLAIAASGAAGIVDIELCAQHA